MEVYKLIPPDQLMESTTNPRRHFSQESIIELSINIKQHGVIEPLIVRPMQTTMPPAEDDLDKYELVCGARRLRAGKLADLSVLPCIVRHLTDDQVFDIQLSENLQRENPTPLDEAQCYQQLIEKKHFSLEEISAKYGKSTDYIFNRMRLLALCDEAKQYLEDEIIPITAAIRLAVLNAKQQKEALKRTVVNIEIDQKPKLLFTGLRDLKVFIDQNVLLPLSIADFDTKDAKLIPDCGACTDCPFRTGNNLFKEMTDSDKCLKPECYKAKHIAFYKSLQKKLAKKIGEKIHFAARFYNADKEYKDLGETIIACDQFIKITEKDAKKKGITAVYAVFIGPDRMRITGEEHDEHGWIKLNSAKALQPEKEPDTDDTVSVPSKEDAEKKMLEDLKNQFYEMNLFNQFKQVKHKGLTTMVYRNLIAHIWDSRSIDLVYGVDIATRYNLKIAAQIYTENDWTDMTFDKDFKDIGAHVSIDFEDVYKSLASLTGKQLEALANELIFIWNLETENLDHFIAEFSLNKKEANKLALSQAKAQLKEQTN